MNIIIKGKKGPSEGQVRDARRKMVSNELMIERAAGKARHNNAAMNAARLKNQKTPLGKFVASIDSRDFARAVQKYGSEEVHSKGFMKHLNKKHPELCPNKH